jgi:CRP/FNR family transcriptional regulator, cyclic AMP receptor protein
MDAARLTSIPLFARMDRAALLSAFAEERCVPAGTTLMRDGNYVYDFIAIVEGEAALTHGEQHAEILGPGDFLGEQGMLGEQQPGTAVTALTTMRLVTLKRWVLRQPWVRKELRRVAGERRHERAHPFC